jgi:hypothetical protein
MGVSYTPLSARLDEIYTYNVARTDPNSFFYSLEISHRGDIPVRPYTAVRQAGSCAIRNLPDDFKLS